MEAKLLPPTDVCPIPNHQFIMKIIIWNSQGALKPNFQNHVRELTRNHDPAIFVVMETKLGGERAREITDRLPFDGAIHTDTIGYAGGLWLLWNSDKVEVQTLANMEQEIYVEVKVVSKAWSHNRNLVDSIDTFTKDAALWNKNSFGNVHAKKKRVLARLYVVQRALSNRPSASLIELEKSFHLELGTILDQERDLWALKSRINWKIQGDRNTSFYHIFVLARRKRNCIASIKNSVGDWITEEREVMEYFKTGFISLYTTSHSKADWCTKKISNWQIQLAEEDKCSLAEMVSLAEIKEALWSMKAYKAPGPDGLHAKFFQKIWLVVGD
ncbi:uncharacterized protein LOC142628901 [Castanea sativa]|uniref:uncharacterized protein LOC142628901 n=1 Tax=Castanea sativa TaxID=21020 RepID=UPI003F64D05E